MIFFDGENLRVFVVFCVVTPYILVGGYRLLEEHSASSSLQKYFQFVATSVILFPFTSVGST
jgi:hypothetical protein